jgi:hypothetical protein
VLVRNTNLISLARRRLTDFSGLQIAVMFVLLGLMASIPVLTHPLPPIEDYINHLARMHVIATIDHDPNLARFYEIDWQIVPNLMVDLVMPPLVRFMNVYLAGQVFTIITFALIISGTLTLNRALFGRWSVLPLMAFPLLYNAVFLVGVMNYQFGIGLALWGLAVWTFLRERTWPLRLIASTVFVVALFFCHLCALGLYGLGLLAMELWRLTRKSEVPLRLRILDFVATGVPFLVAVPLLLKSPTWDYVRDYEWEPRGKIDGLVYIIEVYSDIVAFVLAGAVAAAAVWAVRHRLLQFHPVGWMLLLVGGVVYLVLPRSMFATYMADQRVPIALAFMLIACTQLELRHQLVRRGFVALLLVVLIVRVIEVDVAWAQLSPQTLEFRNSVKRIQKGATILVASADPTGGDDVRDLGLVHAACLAMIERSALVTRAFTVRGKQIMHVRPDYVNRVDTEDGSPPSVEQLIVSAVHRDGEKDQYWQNWQKNYDYLYILFTEDAAPNPAPDILELVADGDRFQLYRVLKTRLTAKARTTP